MLHLTRPTAAIALSRRLVALLALAATIVAAALGASTANAAAPANGKYRITTGATGFTNVLDAAGDTIQPGTPVINWPANGGTNQQWYIEKVSALPNGDPIYEISSVRDRNYCLDVSEALQANGTKVGMWPCNFQVNQQFLYRDNPATKSGSFIARHSFRRLTMPLALGGQMFQWGDKGTADQRFQFYRIG